MDGIGETSKDEAPGPRRGQQERLSQLMDLLAEGRSVSSIDIAERFGVSVATARRDLNALSRQRLVTRTHGGAVVHGAAYELPLHYRAARRTEGKLAIAQAAADMVETGQVVGLTGGTTTSEVARALGRSPLLGDTVGTPSVTIVTNALNIAFELAIRPHVRVVSTGGVARPLTFELVGPLVAESLDQLHLDWAFIGVDGLSAQQGATTHDDGEALVNRRLAMAARRAVVVADSSKLGVATFARILSMDQVDVLITDREPAPAHAADLRVAGVDVVVAAPPDGPTP